MTRVEGENTRLRHYSSAIASPNLVLFQIRRNAETCNSLATSLSQILGCSSPCLIHPTVQHRPRRQISEPVPVDEFGLRLKYSTGTLLDLLQGYVGVAFRFSSSISI